jgi:hypothetical protein
MAAGVRPDGAAPGSYGKSHAQPERQVSNREAEGRTNGEANANAQSKTISHPIASCSPCASIPT